MRTPLPPGVHDWTHVTPTVSVMVCRACKRVVHAIIDLSSGTPRLRYYDATAREGTRFRATPPKGCPSSAPPEKAEAPP